MVDISPCPFCRSKRVEAWKSWNPHYSVECERCGAEGPRAGSEQDAILWWNAAGQTTPAQVKRWRARLKQAEREEQLAQANSPEARRKRAEEAQAREYREWTAKRYAWLHAPIDKEADHG